MGKNYSKHHDNNMSQISKKEQFNVWKQSDGNQEPSQQFYIFGEKTAIFFDLISGRGFKFALPQNLYLYMGGIRLQDDMFLFFGGVNKKMNNISNHTYLVRMKENKLIFSKWANMSQARYTFAYCVMGDYLYVSGGRHYGTHDQAILANVERLDISKGSEAVWQPLSPMYHKRCSHMQFEHLGKIYVLGGYKDNNIRHANIEVYDPEIDQWMMMGIQLPLAIEAALLINISNPLDNKVDLIIFGGRLQIGDTDLINGFSFDLNSNLDETRPQFISYGKLQQKINSLKGFRVEASKIMILGRSQGVFFLRDFSLVDKIGQVNKQEKIVQAILKGTEFAEPDQDFGKFLLI